MVILSFFNLWENNVIFLISSKDLYHVSKLFLFNFMTYKIIVYLHYHEQGFLFAWKEKFNQYFTHKISNSLMFSNIHIIDPYVQIQFKLEKVWFTGFETQTYH